MTVKNLCYVKFNSVNPLYIINDKINGYIVESNGNTYLTSVPTDECKRQTKYEEMRSKVIQLIRSVANNSNDYDEKYIKIKFNPDYDLPSRKMLKLYDMVIVVRSVFNECNKYYPQAFLHEYLYELKMLEYHSTDVSEGSDVNKTTDLYAFGI